MTSEEDVSSRNESQKQSDGKRISYSLLSIRNAFSKGEVIINPAFLNTPESHCIIYFDKDQTTLYSSLMKKEGNPIFLISKQYFVLFQDNIPNDYLDEAQINKIEKNFDLCSKHSVVKECYQIEFKKIASDFKIVVIDLLDNKLRWQKSLLKPKNKHWQRIFAIYGNKAQKRQYNELTQQNKNPSTSTSEILESLSAPKPVATDAAILSKPPKGSFKISSLLNEGVISSSEFPADFRFVEAMSLTTNPIVLSPSKNVQTVQNINEDKESTNLSSKKRKCLEESKKPADKAGLIEKRLRKTQVDELWGACVININ